jgi:hypothetical protein
MRNLIAAVLVLLASGCGAQQGPTEPSDTTARISGRVVGFADGVGVAGVPVSFGDVTAVSDDAGTYTVVLPIGRQEPVIDGVPAGRSYVIGSAYRGDFLVRSGTCVSRYGIVADARTLRPITAATVSLSGKNVASGSDGWYRIDLSCPANGLSGFNTTFISVSHRNYSDYSQVVGRGVYLVQRLDIVLQPR